MVFDLVETQAAPHSKSALERVPQRELNQARLADGGVDFAERSGTRQLHVGNLWIAEVGMVPDVEEVRGKAEILPLGDVEIFDGGEIPVLLERPAIGVALQVAESGGAEVGIAGALRGIEQR